MKSKFRGYSEALGYFVEGSYLYTPEATNDFNIINWIVRKDGYKYAIEKPSSIGQSTGLKDSKNVEIYEGDILTLKYPRDRRYTVTAKVIKGSQVSAMTLKFEDEFTTEEIPLYKISANHNLEVIGNIYEHKYLIKE